MVGSVVEDSASRNLKTANYICAANEVLTNKQTKTSTRSSGPFVQDMFGMISTKTSGIRNSDTIVEFGGTLQNQDLFYIGPVNLRRMTLQMLNDKGTLLVIFALGRGTSHSELNETITSSTVRD
jgi:hypothetical protein